MKRALLVVLFAVSAAACASSRSQVQIEDEPTLVVPPVPPRVIEPVPSTEPQPVEPVENLPATTESPAPKRQSSARDRGAQDPKPEPKPENPPEPPPVSAQPVPPLRTATSPGPEVAQQQVRDVLERARKLLDSIDQNQLSKERMEAFKAAWNFIGEAEAALKTNNYVQAKALADRAEATAKALAGK